MERIRIVNFGVVVLAFAARRGAHRRSLQAYAARNRGGVWEIFQPAGCPPGTMGSYAQPQLDKVAGEHPKAALRRFVAAL